MTTRAASIDLIYGSYHSSKTSRLGDVAEYYWEKTSKPARLVSSDSGGWDVIQPLIDEGIIEAFKLSNKRQYLIQDMQALTQGRWPVDPTNLMSPLEDIARLDNISVLMFDGITSMCDMLMEMHVHSVQMAKDSQNKDIVQPMGVKIAGLPKDNYIQDDKYLRRITSQTDYGEVQRTARELIRNLSFLPIPAVITALECMGEDDDDKPIHGPQFVGKALTGVCGPWFANMVHLDLVPVQLKDEKGAVIGEEARPFMYLRPHYDPRDPMKLRFPAQVRVPRNMWDKVPVRMEPDMKKLYQAIDNLREEARKGIRANGPVEVPA